jgi:hypothetical protein
MRKKLGQFIRWITTWPLLVILALNIESSATQAGYSTIINHHWKAVFPMMKEIYDWATSPWILYSTIFILGASAYEWVVYTISRAESEGSNFQKWIIKIGSDNLRNAFYINGLARKTTKPDQEIIKMNNRLASFNMPLIPSDFSLPEEINKLYASYLLLLSTGEFEHAKTFIESQEILLQSHSSIEVKTPL